MKKKPETNNEWIWFRYIKRKKIEAEKGDILNKKPMVADDPFCSRDMSKDVKNIMSNVTQENHKE